MSEPVAALGVARWSKDPSGRHEAMVFAPEGFEHRPGAADAYFGCSCGVCGIRRRTFTDANLDREAHLRAAEAAA